MTHPTVRRRDISVTEEREADERWPHEKPTFTTHWSAALFGPLSTGEHVNMTRTGDTYTEALTSLESAIAENGWAIKEPAATPSRQCRCARPKI